MTVRTLRDAILHNADCMAAMRGMADASVDAIVTDPPYELGFMGKKWDSTGIANSAEMWGDALRVLKPGGHLLAFSGSRTYHRMTCAIEDAGFEVRDQIMWVYGSGFPKSLDVAKAMDRARVEDVEPVRVVCRAVRAAMDARGLVSRDLVKHFGECNPRLVDHWAARDTDSQPLIATLGQWATLRELFPELVAHDAEAWRLNGRKGTPGEAWQTAEVLGEHRGETPGFVGERFSVSDRTIRVPSDAARDWQGWGTALKPAHEPICVARKPLAGTVAANVQRFGCGALNIDGCRIAGAVPQVTRGNSFGRMNDDGWRESATLSDPSPAGRWPANLIHDGSEEVVAAFPDLGKAGEHIGYRRDPEADMGGYSGAWRKDARNTGFGDSGSAARFFYTAKASKFDREAWNKHPTVKPVDLMRYLVTLVTPPGGTVLDPFMGSGSTGVACAMLGFQFIGIDADAEHFETACRRVAQTPHQLGFDLENLI